MVTKEMVLECMEHDPEGIIQIGTYENGKVVPVDKDDPIDALACTIGDHTFRFGTWKEQSTVQEYLNHHSKEDIAEDIARTIAQIHDFGAPSEAMYYETTLQAHLLKTYTKTEPTEHQKMIFDRVVDAFDTAIYETDAPLYCRDSASDDKGFTFLLGIDDDNVKMDECQDISIPYDKAENLPLALQTLKNEIHRVAAFYDPDEEREYLTRINKEDVPERPKLDEELQTIKKDYQMAADLADAVFDHEVMMKKSAYPKVVDKWDQASIDESMTIIENNIHGLKVFDVKPQAAIDSIEQMLRKEYDLTPNQMLSMMKQAVKKDSKSLSGGKLQ